MLKQITRRRKKYLFLDLLIIICVGIYLRVRIIDMQFLESIQSQNLWIYIIIIALFYHPIGRIKCILIMIILNYGSIYMLNTKHIQLMSNIYKISHDSLYLLIASICLNVFGNKYLQALSIIFVSTNTFDIINIFINLHHIKNLMMAIIIVLCILRLLCRQLPQSNYFQIIWQLNDSKIIIKIISLIITGYITLFNIPQTINLIISSQNRYILPLIFLLTSSCVVTNVQYMREEFLLFALICSTLLLFDNFFIALLLIILIPFLIVIQLFNFMILQDMIQKKVLQDNKHKNYDIIIIINYAINQFCYNTQQQIQQYQIHIHIIAIILFILIWYKERKISKYISKNYEYKSYDQFESARCDDTVL